jgi:rubrerythrin
MSTVQPAAFDGQSFIDSQTHRNLRTACLGEMHTRRLYLHAARCMEEASLHVIAHAFDFTAAQEKEHADVLRGLIAAHGGCSVPMAEDAPLLLPHAPLEILKTVSQFEHDEWDTLYPFYARIADEEGYPRVAEAFRRIAETEQHHAMRFLQYAKALADGSLFRDSKRVSWLCLPCGQLHTGHEAPVSCSGCGKDQGHFIRSSFFPFTVEG